MALLHRSDLEIMNTSELPYSAITSLISTAVLITVVLELIISNFSYYEFVTVNRLDLEMYTENYF